MFVPQVNGVRSYQTLNVLLRCAEAQRSAVLLVVTLASRSMMPWRSLMEV